MTSPDTISSPKALKRALFLYRITAWITGCMLILLVASMIYKYIFAQHNPETLSVPPWLMFIPIAHGWCYFAFLICCGHLSLHMHWPLGKTIPTLFAGTIPLVSFIIEHRRTAEVHRKILASPVRKDPITSE